MAQTGSIKLTAAEIASLWGQYLNDSMAVCILTAFLQHVEDAAIRSVLEYSRSLSRKHINKISHMFESESVPLPTGFTDLDVDLSAPRIYSDPFYLSYIRNMGRIGLQIYSLAFTTTARSDVRNFYHECILSSAQLVESATNLELSKGLYIRSPYIPVPKGKEIVTELDFLGSIIGDQRPLLGIEIDHLFTNAQTNIMGKALLIGFSQTAKDKEVRDYLLRGKRLANHHVEVLSNVLRTEDLPSPMGLDSYVTASIAPVFSDRLMVFHTMSLTATGMGNYGASMAASMRSDLHLMYSRLMFGVGSYAKDGAALTINNHWLEKPPQASSRNALALSR